MTEPKKYEHWVDASGDYFPWLEELWVLSEKSEAERIARGEPKLRRAAELSLPKLSFLVSSLNAIRERPELMQKIKHFARTFSVPENIPEGHGRELGALISSFLNYFELKNNVFDQLPIARSSLYNILYNMEIGKLYDSDADAIRQENISFNPGVFVDDLG